MLGSLVAVLLALAPVYINNMRFSRTVREVVQSPAAHTADDNGVRDLLMAKVQEYNVPVHFGEIRVSHSDGHLGVQLKYAVHVDLGLYRVDLHFHPEATAK